MTNIEACDLLDNLIGMVDDNQGNDYDTALKMAIEMLESKTGKWIIRETAFEDTEAKCSVCGFVTLVNEPGNGLHMLSDLNFCPRCGSFNCADIRTSE